MLLRQFYVRLTCMLVIIAASPFTVYSATVSYSGRVTDEYGGPVAGGLVVVGTFDPAFDAAGLDFSDHHGNYVCVYGDGECNLNGGAYDAAVADGNFIPFPNFFGSDTLTDANGFFSGTASTIGPIGQSIWMFAFENSFPDSFFQVLATSTDPTWSIPLFSTSIVASAANSFVLGLARK